MYVCVWLTTLYRTVTAVVGNVTMNKQAYMALRYAKDLFRVVAKNSTVKTFSSLSD